MEDQFTTLIATLSEARQAVEHEMETLLLHQPSSGARLAHLQKSVGDFSAQADTLVVTMFEQNADDGLVEVAEQLVDFFQDTEAQIRAMLAAGRVRG